MIWLGLGLAFAAFLADILLYPMLPVHVLYVVAVLTTFGHARRDAMMGMVVLTCVMVLVAGLPAIGEVALAELLASRALALAAICATAFLLSGHAGMRQRAQEAEDEAHGHQARLVETLASIGDGVIACDRHGRVEFMNAVAEKLTGWNSREAAGVPLQDVFDVRSETTGKGLAVPFDRMPGPARKAVLDEHAILHSRCGGNWPVDDSISPIRDREGNVTGAVVVFREISDRRRSEQYMELRLREAGHRIANVFANVSAILSMCQRATNDPADLVRCVELRLASLTRSASRLTLADGKDSSAREIIIDELRPYLEYGADRLVLRGEDVGLHPSLVISFAMIVHELANNAAKYGSLSVRGGKVEMTCRSIGGGRYLLAWIETGGPPAAEPHQIGLGMNLVDRLVRTQFSGKWKRHFGEHGYSCEFELELVRTELPAPAGQEASVY